MGIKQASLIASLIGSLLLSRGAYAQDCGSDPINTNSEIGMRNAFAQYFDTDSCGTIGKFDENTGDFYEVHYDVMAHELKNSYLNAQALCGIGDEAQPVTINGGTPQAMTPSIEAFFGKDAIYFHQRNNDPDTTTAKNGTKAWIAQYIPLDVSANSKYKLSVRPNPFENSTGIAFNLDQRAPVSICIYDVQGREVARLKNEFMEPGNYFVNWNGKDKNGINTENGMYFVHFSTPGYSTKRKAVKLD